MKSSHKSFIRFIESLLYACIAYLFVAGLLCILSDSWTRGLFCILTATFLLAADDLLRPRQEEPPPNDTKKEE